MPIYSEDTLRDLDIALIKVRDECVELLFSYRQWTFKNELARTMAMQGFCRRLKTLVHCVMTAFETVPPDSDDIPTDDKLQQCVVSVQAFVFNVFGCMDNLANLWVKERGIKKANNRHIPPLLIGLGEKSADVRASLSVEFQDYLSSEQMKTWLDYQEGYRHALAHRIPLYIPPHGVKESNAPAYQELERRKNSAIARLDMNEHDRLDKEQLKLCIFRPFMTHSWDEETPIMYFHAQMLADYETIVDLGRRMIKELARPLSTPSPPAT